MRPELLAALLQRVLDGFLDLLGVIPYVFLARPLPCGGEHQETDLAMHHMFGRPKMSVEGNDYNTATAFRGDVGMK